MLFLYYVALVCITGIGMLETKSLAKDIAPISNTCQRKEQDEGEILQSVRNKINAIIDGYLAIPECGDGLWYRLAYLNMTNSTQWCPPAWREYNSNGVRACGRPVTSTGSCPATVYSINLQYNRVCGRVIGYQVTTPDTVRANQNIDDIYLDGVSITHGSPRRHVWSYVGAWTEIQGGTNICPCRYSNANLSWPSFIGDNYYCESANPYRQFMSSQLFPNDKLWDGKQCENEGTCCTTKSPPWFSVELPNPTNDDIEVRICGNESTDNEDTPIEMMEIYVH